MWTPEYILSQISVIVATIIFALSYFTKNKKIILVLGLISILFYMLEYLLLHSYIAVGVNFLSFLRTIWFYINDVKDKKQDYVSLTVSMVAFIVISILTYTSPMDVIVLFASLLFTYAIWQQNILVYRTLSALASICWIIYNIYCFTIMGIILEIVLLTIKLVSSIEYIITTKKGKELFEDKNDIMKA